MFFCVCCFQRLVDCKQCGKPFATFLNYRNCALWAFLQCSIPTPMIIQLEQFNWEEVSWWTYYTWVWLFTMRNDIYVEWMYALVNRYLLADLITDADMEDYGFEYSDEEPEEQDVDIENQYYNTKGMCWHEASVSQKISWHRPRFRSAMIYVSIWKSTWSLGVVMLKSSHECLFMLQMMQDW